MGEGVSVADGRIWHSVAAVRPCGEGGGCGRVEEEEEEGNGVRKEEEWGCG